MARNEDSDMEKRRRRKIRFGTDHLANCGSEAIISSRYHVANHERRASPGERMLPRKEESDQPIGGGLELN